MQTLCWPILRRHVQSLLSDWRGDGRVHDAAQAADPASAWGTPPPLRPTAMPRHRRRGPLPRCAPAPAAARPAGCCARWTGCGARCWRTSPAWTKTARCASWAAPTTRQRSARGHPEAPELEILGYYGRQHTYYKRVVSIKRLCRGPEPVCAWGLSGDGVKAAKFSTVALEIHAASAGHVTILTLARSLLN